MVDAPADAARPLGAVDDHFEEMRKLLRSLVGWQSYGIPAVARPTWTVYFRGGWRSGLHGGRLLHQVARLKRGKIVLSPDILTDGDPGVHYGIDTLRGVTLRLLGK